MLTHDLTAAEELKFDLLAEGVSVSEQARERLRAATSQRALTPADYASTSGLILVLGEDVWVNAPVVEHNANFVLFPRHTLDVGSDGSLMVTRDDLEVRARFWVPPLLHDVQNPWGEAYTSYCFSHTDRVRVSPIEGCAYRCQFCDLPYEFAYRRKRIMRLVEAVQTALADPVQPASHVLISGGTPLPKDHSYLLEAFHEILDAFPGIPVDIMMAAVPEVLPLAELDRAGVHELSINLELYGPEAARRYMRRKHEEGREHYLSFIGDAVQLLGRGRVRSMLLAGLEPMDMTLAGVTALAERGCTPVLSPFRPDTATPLRAMAPPTAAALKETYLRARDITQRYGVPLGPSCIPCSHNTMTLAASGAGDACEQFGQPLLIS